MRKNQSKDKKGCGTIFTGGIIMISSIKICCNSECPPIMDMDNFVKVVYSDSIDNSYDILVCNKYSKNIFDVFDKYSRIKCLICPNTIYFKNKKTN